MRLFIIITGCLGFIAIPRLIRPPAPPTDFQLHIAAVTQLTWGALGFFDDKSAAVTLAWSHAV